MTVALASAPTQPPRRASPPWPPRIPGYRIGRRIGEGRAAEVYFATGSDGKAVALKIIKRSGQEAELARQHFAGECAALAAIEHEHVVRMIDCSANGDVAYLAMEYLVGGTLRDSIRAGLTARQAMTLLRQAASGLAVLHTHGIVHRDVKPENYLFRAGGALVLADFGLAFTHAGTQGAAGGQAAVGTPCYASPEQAQGAQPAAAADVYSLGIVFYEMLCGRRPFPGRTPVEIQAQHLMAPVPRLAPHLACYQRLIDGMLEKQAHRRIADGSVLLEEIGRAERACCQQTSSINRVAEPVPC